MALRYAMYNGVAYDHNALDIRFALPGREVRCFVKSLNHDTKRSRTMLYANHPKPIAKTKGQTAFSCDLELFQPEWMMIRDELGTGWQDLFFALVVQLSVPDFDVDTTSILGCTLDSNSYGTSAGGDPTVRKFDLTPLDVRDGGLDSCDVQFIVPG